MAHNNNLLSLAASRATISPVPLTGERLEQFASRVLEILQRMDAEANTVASRLRTGLRDYATHCGSQKSEQSWSAGIARHLSADGVRAETECRYPATRKKCDVVATLPTGARFWIEVKAAWKAYFVDGPDVRRNAPSLYNGYLFGPLVPGLPRTHSTAQDFDKLETLTPRDADWVGLVLIGFDELRGRIEQDVLRLARLKRLKTRRWHIAGPCVWADRNGSACRTCCWFFWRRVQSSRK